jgi:hypothetical protein
MSNNIGKMKTLLEIAKSEPFEDFAKKRLDGATKITNNAKEKGGSAMLTYHHFNVKLSVYKKAADGKFDLAETKSDFKQNMDKLCKLTEDVNMDQIEFQKLVGKIEVFGELIIQNKKY